MQIDAKTVFNSIPEIYPSVAQIRLYCDGEIKDFQRDEIEFAKIIAALTEISYGSHDMPAFGVSLDAETKKASMSGMWLELIFDEQKSFNDYVFESLLFEVKAEDAGFNLIRKVNGRYEGRCLYLSLAGNMQGLADTLNLLCA